MAEYNSSYTGLQIDDAVGKSLAALPVDNTLSATGKAADAKKTGDELNGLKSAMSAFEYTRAVPELWALAALGSSGEYVAFAARLATRRITPNEFSSASALEGYSFYTAAWDGNGTYLGKWTGSSFAKSGTVVDSLTYFDFTAYPTYSFIVVLRNSAGTEMSLTDGENCVFTQNFASSAKTLGSIGGITEVLVDSATTGNKEISWHPATIKAGDLLLAKAIRESGNTKIGIVVKTYLDGVEQDVLINVSNFTQAGKSYCGVATHDANAVGTYATYPTHFQVLRAPQAPDSTITGRLSQTERATAANGTEIDVVAASNSIQLLGELAIAQNRKFIPEEKMKIVMLDNNHKYFSVANIELIIDTMAAHGLNYLMLGFGGSGRGLGFKLDDMHITSWGVEYDLSDCIDTNYGDYLSEADMTAIIAYAQTNGVGIIPSFNMPGHFGPFLVQQKQFRHATDENSVNIDDPQARDYAYKVAEMYMKFFSKNGCKYWMHGSDEFGAVPSTGYHYLHEAGNFNYALFINQIAYIASSYRMIPMAWNDAFCVDGDVYPYLNRAMPILYWTNSTHRPPANVIKQKNGNPLINSSDAIYWSVEGSYNVTVAQMQAFDVTKFSGGKNKPSSATISDPLGACFCIWIGRAEDPSLDDDGANITTQMLPLIEAFGDSVTPQFT